MEKFSNFLFHKMFRNKIFDMISDLQNLMDLYVYIVGGEKIGLVDKYGIVYTEFEIIQHRLVTLQQLVDRNILPDYYDKKENKNGEI